MPFVTSLMRAKSQFCRFLLVGNSEHLRA